MDPDACLQRWRDARTYDGRHEAYSDLASWLRNGGFEPKWANKHERASFIRTERARKGV